MPEETSLHPARTPPAAGAEEPSCEARLQESARSAEKRYREFLRFLPVPVFVFNLDHTVSYLNPAFEQVFGWTLAELEGKRVPFVPPECREETREGLKRLFRDGVIHGFETRRLTRDGRLLDIVIDGAIFYDEQNRPAGQVITLRDVTREKRAGRINEAFLRISQALYGIRSLDERLEFITREVRELLGVEGASVILVDEERREFFFRQSVFDVQETGRRMKEIRFPLDKGVAGEVYRTGRPLRVNDTSRNPFFYARVDAEAGYHTRSMLDVPLFTPRRMIGVLCAVNKKGGGFTEEDEALLSSLANLVALPIENAGVNEALGRTLEEVRRMNRAKDRVIHHLSHELKTPLSVLGASLNLLARGLPEAERARWAKTLERAQRNLQRLFDMQYKIDDLLQERDVATHRLLSALLDRCADELEALAAEEFGEETVTERLRRRIDHLFGPREARPERIDLARYVRELVGMLRPRFTHRTLEVCLQLEPSPPVRIPGEVLRKVVEGLLRNAVENTPDGGTIEVIVAPESRGSRLEIRDTGIGMTPETRDLIFGNFFASTEPLQYATRSPYDFRAGGKGFDLLRMQMFAERFGFELELQSERCPNLPAETDACPGRVEDCGYACGVRPCARAGGTRVIVRFPEAGEESPAATGKTETRPAERP
ncbi:MAG: GAF domain-containing protein [Desulfobacterales bacterium]